MNSSARGHSPNPAAGLFAYPFGEANDYLADEYFPRNAERIRVTAAFTASPAPMTQHSNPWRLPRYVFGKDWKSSRGLQRILDESKRRAAPAKWRLFA